MSLVPTTLEFLPEHEVEVTSALGSIHLVETVCPVDTHHTNHRQIDTHSGSCRALDVERSELFNRSPCISTFEESNSIDSGSRLKHEREVKLKAEARVGITFFSVWGEHTIVVTAQCYSFCSI